MLEKLQIRNPLEKWYDLMCMWKLISHNFLSFQAKAQNRDYICTCMCWCEIMKLWIKKAKKSFHSDKIIPKKKCEIKFLIKICDLCASESWTIRCDGVQMRKIFWRQKKTWKIRRRKTAIMMCSRKIISLKLCRRAYSVLFILLYGLTIAQAAISGRNSKPLGES